MVIRKNYALPILLSAVYLAFLASAWPLTREDANSAWTINREEQSASAPKSAKQRRSAESSAKLDLNTATKEELDSLPGIGEANAQKIIDGRPYKSKNDLVRKGVLPTATYDKIKDQITAREGGSSSSTGSPSSETSRDQGKPVPVKASPEPTGKSSGSVPTDKPSGSSSRSVQSNSGPTAQAPPEKGMVWVNLKSGVYHREGDPWYGKTKRGKFMSEADAEKAGYRASKTGAKGNEKEE